MQKDRVNNSINGEGIYEERVSDKAIVCISDNKNVEQTQFNEESEIFFDINQNNLSTRCDELPVSEERFDVILDALDQQVETLNELRRSSFKQSISLSSNTRAACNNQTNLSIKNSCPKPPNSPKHLNPSYRKSVLETYVRTNVPEDFQCGCRFHFDSNELNLLNELNECYRKFCQFNSDQLSFSEAKHQASEQQQQRAPTQQVIEEASNFIGCEREISRSRSCGVVAAARGVNGSCLPGARQSTNHDDDDTEQRQQPASNDESQQRTSPSNKLKGPNGRRLFINAQSFLLSRASHWHKSGATDRIGGQLAHARSDSIIPEAAAAAQRHTPLVSRMSRSEATLDNDPFRQIVEPHLDPESISDCHLATSDQSYSTGSDALLPSENRSSPEQRSALVGIEELPVCDPNCRLARTINDCKRKRRSPRSRPKRYKQRAPSSSSSLNESFASSDYQLGCSLTYESVASPSPRQFSPFELQTPVYHCASSGEDFGLTTASNRTRASDHCAAFQHTSRQQQVRRENGPVGVGPSKAATPANSLFIPAENYHFIESCASYEIEESGTSPQPRVELPDERCSAFASSSADCRGNRRSRRRRRRRRRNRCPPSNAYCETFFQPSTISCSPAAFTNMESDGTRDHDNGNDSAHNSREACRGLRQHQADNSSSSPPTPSKSYGSAREKHKQAKSPNTRERDASCLRLGTNAKTRLQRRGVEIQHQHPRPARSSSESSNCGGTPYEPPTNTMKAAKDIAKVSLPALASLQYLPGQLDVHGSRSIDRFSANRQQQAACHEGAQVRRCSSMTQQIDSATQACVAASGAVTLRSKDDSSSVGKHDDSCLFGRLGCLCNCLACSNHGNDNSSSPSNTVKKPKNRSVHQHGGGVGRENMSPSSSGENCSSSRRWRIRERKSRAKAQVANGPAASGNETNLSGKQNARSSAMRDVARDSGLGGRLAQERCESEPTAREPERQSPSFMNLLKPSQPKQQQTELANKRQEAYKAKKYSDPRAVAQRDKQSHRGVLRATSTNARICSTALGSIGDLAASGRSSASDSHMSECSSPADFIIKSSKSPRATKVLSKSARNTDLLKDDSCHLEEPATAAAANNQSDRKSPTACTNPAHNSHQSKRVPAYKKLLSPRKLFSSSSSSVCDCCEQVQQHQEHHQPSFLSRSLSGWKRRASNSSSQRDQPTEGAWPRSPSCTSPTISISNNSQPDTYSDSINSLDEINLTHSLPFSVNEEVLGRNYYSKKSVCLGRVPDIVLNRVEYQDVASSSSSFSMTRSPSGHEHYRPSSAQSPRNHDHTPNSYQPYRHGSKLSFNASDTSGSFHQPRGPFSLPGSPDSRRRNRNRSPRLSQSPVPFQSPANESTKIEDGLNVCSTEHFEKHIGTIKDNQIEAQKRLFTAWINHFAPNLIRHDLIEELQDGIKLIGLLASLTHDKQLLSQYERLNSDKQSYINRIIVTPSSRLKHLSNVSIAIDYLRKNQGMKLVNLNPMDIVSGKANVILGLCWSIILNFQFDKNLLKVSDSSSNHSSNACQSTSRLSTSHTNEDRARGHNKQVEEFTTKDVAEARNGILNYFNKRFNLKLTNLTSSLIDGDVLLAIIKQLMLPGAQIDLEGHVYKSKSWSSLSDDEKLDCSFELAKDHLNVPKLVSAADLRQQTIGENNPKPLLIYLSMLLKAESRNCSTDQKLELIQLDEIIKRVPEDRQPNLTESKEENINSTLAQRLNAIDAADKFYIEKLQATIEKINEIDNIVEVGPSDTFDQNLIDRHLKLKRQAEQVESLIDWINKAGQLFEKTPRSSSVVARTIDEYQRFFSREHLPEVDTTLCPTLERQYRECLATAKQRVMSMEQIMKNWLNYNQARRELKKWLDTSETKLSEALRPCNSQDSSSKAQQSENPFDLHMSRLDDLVAYFELEPIDMEDFEGYMDSTSSNADGLSPNPLGLDQSNRSLSGSLISIGSTGSRMSTLTSSKNAAYHRLFDDFELKCRLLAAMMEAEQRDELLIIVKELKSKLKYITEYKVPQVVGEILMSINRCQMSNQKQDECSSENDDQVRDSNQSSVHVESTSRNSTNPSTDPASYDAEPSCQQSEQSELPRGRCDGSDLKMPAPLLKKNKKRDNGKPNSKKPKPGKKSPTVKTAISLTGGKVSPDDDKDLPYIRRMWKKLVRASKISLSFNIVLLICLAGICVFPLIQRDACCELSQSPIAGGEVTVNQRPT